MCHWHRLWMGPQGRGTNDTSRPPKYGVPPTTCTVPLELDGGYRSAQSQPWRAAALTRARPGAAALGVPDSLPLLDRVQHTTDSATVQAPHSHSQHSGSGSGDSSAVGTSAGMVIASRVRLPRGRVAPKGRSTIHGREAKVERRGYGYPVCGFITFPSIESGERRAACVRACALGTLL